MVTIEVRLYASLRKYHPEPGSSEAFTVTVDDDTRLGDLADKLNIPGEEVAISMVNGKHGEESDILQDGDRIGLFPPIGGG